MTSARTGLLILILVFAASGLFLVRSSYGGSIPIIKVQIVQRNPPFVYEGFDNPNDYNWQGNWDPRSDPDWNRHYNHERDTGNSQSATAPCRD
jgi:hypothetical protein